MDTIPIEFEIKAALKATEDVSELLQELEFNGKKQDSDIYFDTTDRELFQRGVFFRLRNSSVLEIKHNPNGDDLDHLSCEERKYKWPLDASARKRITHFLELHLICPRQRLESDPFKLFQLTKFVSIEKNRSVYHGRGIEVSLDQVAGLGLFLEVEARGSQGVKKVKSFCSRHSLKNLPLGYVELWLKSHDFKTYCKGKYILDEDKNNAHPTKEAHVP